MATLYTGGVAAQPPERPSLARLFIELAQNPELLARYRENPDEVLNEFELSEGQKHVLLKGDLDAIRGALEYEYAAGIEGLPTFGQSEQVEMMIPIIFLFRPRPTF